MINKIDHIGIAVKNLKKALQCYEIIFGLKPVRIETMQENHIRMAFFRFDKVFVDLLEPTASGCGRIGKFIQSYGEGIEHIAFNVSNLDKEIERFNREKIEMIDKKPRSGANGSRIAYINPAFTQNVLTELVEKNSDQD